MNLKTIHIIITTIFLVSATLTEYVYYFESATPKNFIPGNKANSNGITDNKSDFSSNNLILHFQNLNNAFNTSSFASYIKNLLLFEYQKKTSTSETLSTTDV